MSFWARKKDDGFAQTPPGISYGEPPEQVADGRVGFIDRIERSSVKGWCWDPLNPWRSLAVEAEGSNGEHVVVVACLFRRDVKDAGRGTGFYGFEIDLDAFTGADSVMLRFADSREPISREPIVLDPVRSLLTRELPPKFLQRTRELCFETMLRHKRLEGKAPPDRSVPCDPRLLEIVDPKQDPEGLITRFVMQECDRVVRDAFDTEIDGTLQERLGVLLWYLDHYALSRSFAAHVPLTPGQIAVLNAPALLGGLEPAITVALQNFILRNRPSHANLADPTLLRDAIYWWCIDKAPSLRLEHTLVTPDQINFLRRGESGAGTDFPCNLFMIGWHAAHPALHELDLDLPRDRGALLVHLVVASFMRPDLLRYLPSGPLRVLLRPEAWRSPLLDGLLARFAGADEAGIETDASGKTLRGMGEDLLSAAGLRLAPGLPRREREPEAPRQPALGVGVIGPIRKSSGLGRAARLSLATLAAAETVAPAALAFDLENPAPGGTAIEHATLEAPREITLLHLNAEAIPLAFAYGPRELLADSYRIGFFFWELNEIPACQTLGIELVDEIWVASEYNRAIYAEATDKPVIRVGMAAPSLPAVAPAPRDAYGLEDDRFVFLAVFDSLSFIARKNPLGLVEAFRRAFPRGDEPVQLVLKTQNRGLVSDGWQVRTWTRIDRLVAADPRIVMIDETLAFADLLALTRACDAYVSLHRAEGWGFGLVEAMQLGLPVICTGYSGNADFCTPDTAFLVDHTLIPVEADEYIYVPRGSVWADPSMESAAVQMRHVVADRAAAARKVDAARAYVAREMSLAAVSRRYAQRLAAIRGERKRGAAT